jgi:hypothetical protein
MVITPQMVILVLAIPYQILMKLFKAAQSGQPVDIGPELEKINGLRLRPAAEIEAEADAISKTPES